MLTNILLDGTSGNLDLVNVDTTSLDTMGLPIGSDVMDASTMLCGRPIIAGFGCEGYRKDGHLYGSVLDRCHSLLPVRRPRGDLSITLAGTRVPSGADKLDAISLGFRFLDGRPGGMRLRVGDAVC